MTLASPLPVPAVDSREPGAVRRHSDRPSPAARPHVRVAAQAEMSALLNRGARARAVAQLTQRLARRPSPAARRGVAADTRDVPARRPAQRVTDGTLTVPQNPARTTVRPDAQISIAKRLGKGTDADLVTATSSTPVFEVLSMTDAEAGGSVVRPDKRDIDPANLYPHTTEFFNQSRVVGTMYTGQQAKLEGDWLEPVERNAYAARLAVSVPTGSAPPYATFPGLGAVAASDVALRTNEAPLAGHSFVAETGVLFPVPPSLDHIRQGSLADCGFLAALGAIMLTDSEFPRRIMRGAGAQVTVRLFDIDLTPQGKTFAERYVTIDRSSVFDAHGDEAFAHDWLWVKMLEKAYVAAGYLATQKLRSPQASYASLESMNVDIAFGHLVGRTSQSMGLTRLPPNAQNKYPARNGAYDTSEVDAFDGIEDALAQGRSVVVETRGQITKKPTNTPGFSGGEQVAKGLVGGHAYTVLKTERVGPPQSARLVVQVRNPWGNYGTTSRTAPQAGKPVANAPYPVPPTAQGADPDFWLDVRDLLRRFEKVTIAT